jgi:hypothetical protein
VRVLVFRGVPVQVGPDSNGELWLDDVDLTTAITPRA